MSNERGGIHAKIKTMGKALEPYHRFEGVDYAKIMALNLDSIRIDLDNEAERAA